MEEEEEKKEEEEEEEKGWVGLDGGGGGGGGLLSFLSEPLTWHGNFFLPIRCMEKNKQEQREGEREKEGRKSLTITSTSAPCGTVYANDVDRPIGSLLTGSARLIPSQNSIIGDCSDPSVGFPAIPPASVVVDVVA